MRAIDADALITKIRRLPNAGTHWFVSAEAVFDAILKAPTIEPQSEISLDESCTDCPLYDKDRHSCPRFNKVIPEVLREVMAERRQDGQ